MDRDIVEQKLESLRRCLLRVSDFFTFAKVVAAHLDTQ